MLFSVSPVASETRCRSMRCVSMGSEDNGDNPACGIESGGTVAGSGDNPAARGYSGWISRAGERDRGTMADVAGISRLPGGAAVDKDENTAEKAGYPWTHRAYLPPPKI